MDHLGLTLQKPFTSNSLPIARPPTQPPYCTESCCRDSCSPKSQCEATCILAPAAMTSAAKPPTPAISWKQVASELHAADPAAEPPAAEPPVASHLQQSYLLQSHLQQNHVQQSHLQSQLLHSLRRSQCKRVSEIVRSKFSCSTVTFCKTSCRADAQSVDKSIPIRRRLWKRRA